MGDPVMRSATLTGQPKSVLQALIAGPPFSHWVTRNIPVFSLLFWSILILPRVVTLGFYEGDWFDIAVPRDLAHYWIPFSSRPVVVLIYAFLNEVIGFHAWVWQLILAALVLACAICLYRLFRTVSNLGAVPDSTPKKDYSLSSDLVVVCWLAFPWNLGWSAWPTLIMGGIALLFFLLFCLSCIDALCDEGKLRWPSFFYLLCIFSYETFYFAFFLILGLLFILLGPDKYDRQRFWKLFAWLCLIQVLALSYNRAIAYLISVGSSKPAKFMAFKQWPDAVLGLPGHLSMAMSGKAAALVDVVQFMSVAAALLLALALCFPKKRGTAARLAFFAFLALVGIGSSVLLYGFGYYGVIGVGTMSRTNLGISFWLALLF